MAKLGGVPPKRDLETVKQALQRAHDDGVVDIDKPLRDAIPAIERVVSRIKGEGPVGARGRSGYCLVGDAGWLSKPAQQ